MHPRLGVQGTHDMHEREVLGSVGVRRRLPQNVSKRRHY
jgi:hypothetical protein